MTGDALKAALYLEAVLPALAILTSHDAPLKTAAAGPRAFAVTLTVRGQSPRRLAFASDGTIATSTAPQPGDLRLWFPSAGQFLRTVANRPALTLPLGGWNQLPQVRRFSAAGARLETLLNTRADSHLVLHAWGSLIVALSATAAWLRHHPDGPSTHARLGTGTVVFACAALPAPLWIDLASLTSGTGEPASPVSVRIEFADLTTLLAELDNELDAPAALGLGTLRVTGYLPLAENLSLVLLKVGTLLRP